MMLKYLLLGTLLAAQAVPMTDNEYFEYRKARLEAEEQLEREWKLSQAGRARNLMFTLVARYGDGTPAQGYISCDGLWCKYGGGKPSPTGQEPELCAQSLPFRTDTRGACIFNPSYNDTIDDEGEAIQFVCRATAGTRSGKLTFYPSDGGVHVITIPGEHP
jgi:hypothetical protein